MTEHLPTFESMQPIGSTTFQWMWICSCGEHSFEHWTYKTRAQLDYLRHRYPDQDEPVHTATYTDSGFGTTEWTCSCGTTSRHSGHKEPGRARQAHGNHVMTATKAWYATVAKAEAATAARQRLVDDRWDRLTPEGRAHTAQNILDELL